MKPRAKGSVPTRRNAGVVKVSPARVAAFEILRRVEEEGAFASVLLASIDEEMRADDRALGYELVQGVLRWQLWLDRLIERYAGRRASKLDTAVRLALRLGLYQLRFLSRIPPSAVVNESVNLAHRARLRSAAAFINAVLRRATREPDYDPAAEIENLFERISVETSHPAWLIERWSVEFGVDETRAFALANNQTPPVAFRLTDKQYESVVLDELHAAGAHVSPSQIVQGAWRVEGAGGRLRQLAQRGLVYLQDEASQLVTNVLDAQAGERVLDVCAAPGSKTTHIAARTPDVELIVAGDLHAHRLRPVLGMGARQSVNPMRQGTTLIQPVVYDAIAGLPFMDSTFDRVLVDAPCTGTGTLRRNPEIRWRISTRDIAELALRQRRILRSAARTVRRGGRLVYSTCSVERDENETVVADFLNEHRSFKRIEMPVSSKLLTAEGAARTWPQRDGADGFFIVALARET